MRCSRSVRLLGLTAVAVAALLVLAAPGCSSQAAPVEEGGACEVVSDCAAGLICAPTAKAATACPCTCTNNLGNVQQLPPSTDAGGAVMAQDAAAMPEAAASNDAANATSDSAAATSGDSASSTPLDAAGD